MTEFVHLHVHSAYSLAEGAIRVKELVKLCAANNMPAVAVTDTNNLFGAMEFAIEAAGKGIQPILGCQLTVSKAGEQVVLLVQNEEGYKNLSKIISDAYLEKSDEKTIQSSVEALEQNQKGLICLSGGPLKGLQNDQDFLKLKAAFEDRFYIELQRHGSPGESAREEHLINLAYAHNIPLVATNDCYFPTQDMHEAHDALLCIAEGRYVTEEERRKATHNHYFKSTEVMVELFKDLPEAVQNTVNIARRCHFLLKPINPILPPFETEGGRDEVEELKAQAEEGLKWRLENFVQGRDPEPYWERLKYELDTIIQMGFPGYFLIVSDFIKWAKEQDIPVGPGRGSGAGSVVAWALKITDLDPLEFDLLFERFLNPERVSMPDFDVDFCQDRRDEVIRYVQEKYGYGRVAQIITFGKLQARAVVRDVGRVLQMPYGQVDRLAKMIPNNPANPITLGEALEQDADLRAERDKDETNRKLIDIALKLEGLYRHASTHAAGVVIGDRDLHKLVPLYRDPRSDMPVTQFNMKYVEQAGLVKFDFLGLKTLTVVQETLKLIKESRNEEIDILQIPLDDSQTYEFLSTGTSTGVFQLESSGMKDVLRKMKPNRFEDIIALVSLYRPGPMDNIPKYISTKSGAEEPDYLHPKLKPILEETFGIMIYQEQVMQAAQILSGYTLGGADLLRRAMGKKIKEAMDAEQEKFIKGAFEKNDVPENQAVAIFDQIAKFAGYGFNKSHAAAYALIAYQTAWLKANYPVEFMAASMTLDYGNTDKLSIFKQELDRMKITLLPPDVNASDVLFTVEKAQIRYALAALKGVGEGAMERLVQEREKSGDFQNLADFISRIDHKTMNKRQFQMMVSAGAFDTLHDNRAQLYESTEILLRHAASKAEEKELGQNNLFGDAQGGRGDLPPLAQVQGWDSLDQLAYEFDAIGFYLSAHPLDSRAGQLSKMKLVLFSEVESALMHSTSSRLKMAGILIRKQEKISKSGNKFAFLQVSDPTGVYEVTIFSDTLARSRNILNVGNALLLHVDAEQNEDQIRFTSHMIEPLDSAAASKLERLSIHFENIEAVKHLKQLLDVEGEGNIKIDLQQHLDGFGAIEMKIPGRYAFSPEAIRALRNNPSVGKVIES